jgi:hypothetical protein
MSNPGGSSGLTPTQWGVTGTDGSVPAKSSQTQDAVTTTLQDQFSSNQFANLGGSLIAMILSFIGSAIAAILGGFASVIDAIFGTVNNEYVSQIPIITDHTNSINTLTQAFDQLILQGNARVYTSNGTYVPTVGIKSVDVIILGAGGGGSSGSYDFFTSGPQSGGGGGGGGEVHTTIPASLLPVDGSGNFTPISITIGAGGAGGASDQAVGTGGGNTIFGSGAASLTAGGGNGGAWGHPAPSTSGLGGVGMIPGGNGGIGSYIGSSYTHPTAATSSSSAYDLHGGGGGGGAGSGNGNDGSAGGAGGK